MVLKVALVCLLLFHTTFAPDTDDDGYSSDGDGLKDGVKSARPRVHVPKEDTAAGRRWGKVKDETKKMWRMSRGATELSESNWNNMYDYIRDQVANYRKQKAHLSKMVERSQYNIPPAFDGIVLPHGMSVGVFAKVGGAWQYVSTKFTRDHHAFMGKHGKERWFVSEDETMETVMLYVQQRLATLAKTHAKYNERLERLKSLQQDMLKAKQGCRLSLGPHPDILNNAFLFEQGVANHDEEDEKAGDEVADVVDEQPAYLYATNDEEDYMEDDDDDEDDEEENADEISTYAAMQAIQKGSAGFGDNAYLDWSNLPEVKEKKKSMGTLEKFRAKFKDIYRSVIDTAKSGIKKVISFVTKAKTVKNAEELEFADKMFEERWDKVNGKQREEIGLKAADALERVEEMEQRLAPNDGPDMPRQLALNIVNDLRPKAKRSRALHREMKKMQMHPFDFLSTRVRYRITARLAHKQYKKLDADQARLLDNFVDLTKDFYGHSKSPKFEEKAFRALVKAMQKENREMLTKDKHDRVVPLYDALVKREREFFKDWEETKATLKDNKAKLKQMQKDHDKRRNEVLKALGKLGNEYPQAADQIEMCARLVPLVEAALYPTDPEVMEQDEHGYELRGRLGGQIINSVISAKDLRDLMMQLSLSIFGSGLIALLFDAVLWPIVTGILFHFIGVFAFPLSVCLYSLTPLFAETFDSLVIKRALAASRGAPFIPKKATLMKNFKAALVSGTVASFGSIPNNAMEYAAGVAFLPLNIATNTMATATSAAMVPSEIHEAEEQTGEHVLKKIKVGFFPMPDLDKLVDQKRLDQITKKLPAEEKPKAILEAKREALHRFVHKKVDKVMDLSKTTGMARNSMSTGIVLSLIAGFAPFYALQQLGLVAANVVKIILIIFNAPTEILSMSVDRIMSSKGGWDKKKNKRMVATILQKGIMHLKKPKEQMPEITEDEVYALYYSNFFARGMNKFGKGVVNVMTVGGRFLSYCGGKIASAMAWLSKVPLVRNLVGYIREVREDLRRKFLPMMEEKLIVPNWKQDVVYLVTYPRTSQAPSYSPAALKLETWLMLRKFRFYRVTHGYLLADLFGTRVPFIELNGQKIGGSVDFIIRHLEKSDTAKATSHLIMDLSQGEPVSRPGSPKTPPESPVKAKAEKPKRLKSKSAAESSAPVAESAEKLKRRKSTKLSAKPEPETGLALPEAAKLKGKLVQPQVETKEQRKERQIRRLMDETVWRCIMYDRDQNLKVEPLFKQNVLGNDLGLYEQLAQTLPLFYVKWFNRTARIKSRKYWDWYFAEERKKHTWNKGLEIMDTEKQLLYDLIEEGQMSAARLRMFRRYKRKLYSVFQSQKVREYKNEDDKWHVEHSLTKVSRDKTDEKSKRYKDLEVADYLAKLQNAMAVAAEQLKRHTKGGKVQFLFGDKPTPADASLFAHLVQLLELPLTVTDFAKYIDAIRKPKHEENVLVQFVEQYKIRLGFGKAGMPVWDDLRYRKSLFNFEWAVPAKVPEKYDGPFALRTKDELAVDYDFLGVNTDEAEEHAEAETFEENEEDDADAEETEEDVLFDSEEERKERAERREIREQERAEREKYSAEQLTMFAMFEEKATWEHIEGSQMLYKDKKDPGNFLWRYPKVVTFIANRILRVTDCDKNAKIGGADEAPAGAPLDHGLDRIDRALAAHTPFDEFFDSKQNEQSNPLVYIFRRKSYKENRAASARALFHLMAIELCDRQQTDPAVKEACRKKHEPAIEAQLKRIDKKRVAELMQIYRKYMNEVVGRIYENFNQLVDPLYGPEDLEAMVPFHENKMVDYTDGDAVERGLYYVDQLLMYYYPEQLLYIVYGLMGMAKLKNEVEVPLAVKVRYARVMYGNGKDLQEKEKALMAILDKLNPGTTGKSQERAKENLQLSQFRIAVARAMVSLAAAYLCKGTIGTHKCGDVHAEDARAHIAHIKGKQLNEELVNSVRHLVHQIIINYNEQIAYEELTKYSTKIVADLEMLPKGPGFWSNLGSQFNSLIQKPPKELEEEAKSEMEKISESEDLHKLEQNSGFAGSWLSNFWQSVFPPKQEDGERLPLSTPGGSEL